MSEGIGWLPVEAREQLEEEQAKAGAEVIEKLLALDDRARVLALLDWVLTPPAERNPPHLRPEHLRRLLESFAGANPLPEELPPQLAALAATDQGPEA